MAMEKKDGFFFWILITYVPYNVYFFYIMGGKMCVFFLYMILFLV